MANFSQNIYYINILSLKTLLSTFYIFLLCILAFSCISYNSTISLVDVYPIDVNPIEVYPIEAYLIGKSVVEVSGCHRPGAIKASLLSCMFME
jgi:hypothetical protein